MGRASGTEARRQEQGTSNSSHGGSDDGDEL